MTISPVAVCGASTAIGNLDLYRMTREPTLPSAFSLRWLRLRSRFSRSASLVWGDPSGHGARAREAPDRFGGPNTRVGRGSPRPPRPSVLIASDENPGRTSELSRGHTAPLPVSFASPRATNLRPGSRRWWPAGSKPPIRRQRRSLLSHLVSCRDDQLVRAAPRSHVPRRANLVPPARLTSLFRHGGLRAGRRRRATANVSLSLDIAAQAPQPQSRVHGPRFFRRPIGESRTAGAGPGRAGADSGRVRWR